MEDCHQMMHKFHELIREADVHKDEMVENQTDFHTVSCFLVDSQIYYWTDFFQKLCLIPVPNIGHRETGL